MTNQMVYIHESYSSLYPVITKNHLDICERLFPYILYKKRPVADVLQIKFFKISQYSQENTCIREFKRDSDMGVLLRILQNFQEQLFCTTHMVAASDCFVVFFFGNFFVK